MSVQLKKTKTYQSVTTDIGSDSIDRLIQDCIDAGVKISLKDDKLSVKAAKNVDISAIVESIRRRKPEVEAFLKNDRERDRRIALGPVRLPENEGEVSSGQERLWFLFQFEEDKTNYNMFGAYKVLGDFDYQALDAALQAIVYRHQVLRSYIEQYDGELVNKLAPVSRVHIPVDDLSDMPEDDRAVAVQNWLQLESECTFDLSVHPLSRFRLVKTAEEEHIFAFSIHHILCDGVSEAILLHELNHWYQAFVNDPDTEVPEIPLRYCDFAAWQKNYIGSMRYLRDLNWWRKNLDGVPPLLEVPTDKPRPPVPSNSAGWVNFTIEKEVTERLWQIGRDNGTTTFMVGLTLFGLLLRDYSGQNDFVIGTPVSNRNHQDLEALVGFFVNTVPLRMTFDKQQSFIETLKAVSLRSLESFDRQHVPFEHLVGELGVKREASYNPIFQSMFLLQDANDFDVDESLGLLTMEAMDVSGESGMFDLDLQLTGETEGHLTGSFSYNPDLYHKETAELMCERFQNLLKLVSENPELSIAGLSQAGTCDERSLTIGIGEQVDYKLGTTIDAEIAATTLENPGAIAVQHNDLSATYAELDQFAATIAQALSELGVGPSSIVAVETPRSIPFLAAILGVLRTGGCYVPIDPEYPMERRSYMIEDSGAAVVIRDVGSDEQLSAATVEVGDKQLHLFVSDDGEPITPTIEGDSDVAYMIYTSGSTGRPKGALVRHDGALNHIYAECDALGLADDFVFLQTAASSSDISVWQFFGPLIYGGRTVIVDTHTMLDAKALFELIQSSKATIVELVPSVVQLLGEYVLTLDAEERELPSLRCMLITGEAAPVPVINAWLHFYPQVPIVNAYGPTEAADDVCQAVIREPIDIDARSVTIGKPLANLSIYVLDSDLEPLPIGAVGEICIAGVGVGAGYHRQPERTAQSFVPNPYATGEADKQLYRTGDSGRWREDGQLDFIGRLDSQVKIRGFRIELGEVTACVVSHESVREAATVVAEHAGSPQLVSYYSTVADQELETDALRSYLKDRLPNQVVPNLLVPLDDLPHLPNGKIDLHNLPRPELTLVSDVDESQLTDTQREVRLLWSELLQVPSVPLDADFFDCGGHSLMAVRMLARIREHFSKDISVADFFATPVLSQFCALLDATEESEDTVFLKAAHKSRYPLSPGQARLWFLNLFEEDAETYNMPGALRMSGALDVEALNRVLNRLFDRHASMRTRILVDNGTPYQEILPHEAFQIPIIDLSEKDQSVADKELKERIQGVLDTAFKLDEAPLCRFELVKVAENDYYLLNVAHHIISDGISNALLINELITLYVHEQAGVTDLPFEPLDYQYGDYAEWQIAIQSTASYRRQVLYWERKLSDAPRLLGLPTDQPRPATQTYNGDSIEFDLPAELVPALRELSQASSATMFMLFQAVTAAVLRCYSGQNDIVTGTPIGGRRLAELETIVGFFVNTVVLRTHIDPDAGFAELLEQVRTNSIEAFDNSDVPFEQIVERLGAERNPAFSPVFQVMIGYDGDDRDDEQEFPGVDIEVIEMNEKTAMFDLDILFDDDGENEISGTIIYNTDLFYRETIERMSQHLVKFLEAVVADSQAPLSSIDIASKSEIIALEKLEIGNEPSWEHTSTLVSEFEKRVSEYREKTAVTDGIRTLSYEKIDEESAWLASELVDHNVEQGDFVAIVADRTTDFLSALMGVLRAGAAYVPVDPTYPEGRVTHMLSDSAAELIITTVERLSVVLSSVEGARDCTVLVLPSTQSLPVSIDAPAGCKVVALTAPENPVTAPDIKIKPDKPAYMIYTSGSTGKPKGAINTHRGQLNHILAEAQLLRLGANTTFAQTAPSSSDISVWQFVGPLVLGGTTAIITTDELLHADRLLSRITGDGINLIELVPALFDHLLDYVEELADEERQGADAALLGLSAAMITGEAAPVPTINRWFDMVPDVPMINAYGPTETADDVCQHQINEPINDEIRNVPIGRPVPGMSLLILDDQLRRVPRGVHGELCVAGVGVGSGYWRRPDLTKDVFVNNPYTRNDYDQTLYRTGDIGRWNSEGLLEYIGRRDGQVNVLGMRIELGEIESALTALPEVKESAVVVLEESPPRVIAFWVGADIEQENLEEQLRDTLPSHMVPKSWMKLEQLPRNPIGKIDYARLKEGAAKAAFAAKEYVAPETDDEVVLTGIWADILDAEQVSVNADFFDWGGNSLLAVQATRRIEEHFGVILPLVDFFRQPTVSGVLSSVNRLRAEQLREDDELDEISIV